MLMDQTVKNYVEQVDSKQAAPGGGSVCGLCGALGISLIRMYAHLSIHKKAFLSLEEEKKQVFFDRFNSLEVKKEQLLGIIDADKEAYEAWLKAFQKVKLEDNEENQSLLEEATKQAIQIPYQCMNYALDAMKLSYDMIQYGNRMVLSDLMIGVIYLEATLHACVYNIKANLYQADEDENIFWNQRINELLKEGNQIFEAIQKAGNARL